MAIQQQLAQLIIITYKNNTENPTIKNTKKKYKKIIQKSHQNSIQYKHMLKKLNILNKYINLSNARLSRDAHVYGISNTKSRDSGCMCGRCLRDHDTRICEIGNGLQLEQDWQLDRSCSAHCKIIKNSSQLILTDNNNNNTQNNQNRNIQINQLNNDIHKCIRQPIYTNASASLNTIVSNMISSKFMFSYSSSKEEDRINFSGKIRSKDNISQTEQPKQETVDKIVGQQLNTYTNTYLKTYGSAATPRDKSFMYKSNRSSNNSVVSFPGKTRLAFPSKNQKYLKGQGLEKTSSRFSLQYSLKQFNIYGNSIQWKINRLMESFIQEQLIDKPSKYKFYGDVRVSAGVDDFNIQDSATNSTSRSTSSSITKPKTSQKTKQKYVQHQANMLISQLITKIQSHQFSEFLKQYKMNIFSTHLYEKMYKNELSSQTSMAQFKKCQFVCKLILKYKKQGMLLYDLHGYSVIMLVCDKLVRKVVGMRGFLDRLYGNLGVSASSNGGSQNVDGVNKSEDIKIQSENIHKQKQTKQATPINKKQNSNITIPQLSILLTLLQTFPQNTQQTIYSQFLKTAQNLSTPTVSKFMLDSIIYKRKLTFQFLKQFHSKIKYRNFHNCTRYTYLLFIKQYMNTTYFPIHDSMEHFRKPYYFQVWSFEDLLKIVKLLALEYQVALKCQSRAWFVRYNRKVYSLDRFISTKKVKLYQLIKLYNVLCQVFPMGLYFIRQMNLYSNSATNLKQLRLQGQYLAESIVQVKKFIKNILKNLQPKYIYSLQQKSTKQINRNICTVGKNLLKQLMLFQPKFLIECSELFNYYEDLGGKFSSNLMTDVEKLLQSWNVSQDTVYKVLTKNNKINDDNQKIQKNNDKSAEHIENYKQKQSKPQIVDITEQQLIKLTNFVYKNVAYFQQSEKLQNFYQNIYEIVMKSKIKRVDQVDDGAWRFLYQLSMIIQKLQKGTQTQTQTQTISHQKQKVKLTHQSAQNKIRELYIRFCSPYISQNHQHIHGSSFIRKPKLHEQYILRIANILNFQQYFKKSQKQCTNLANFINKNFIFVVKSVIRVGVYDILKLLDRLLNEGKKDINPEIFAFLYGNLSSFIIYVQSTKNFYLKRGKNLQFDKKNYTTLINALKNWNVLNKITNKDQLSTIRLLCRLYWKKLTNKQMGQFLMITGTPTLLGQNLGIRVKKFLAFKSQQQIEGLDRQILSKFKFQNKSLMKLLTKTKDNTQDAMNTKLTNTRKQEQILQLFQHTQFYEQALQTNTFTNQKFIPVPKTNDPKIKMIYACLKMVQKIRQKRDFTLSALLTELQSEPDQNNDKQTQPSKQKTTRKKQPVDYKQVQDYIMQQNLIKLDKTNQFKLDNTSVRGHNQMIQCWNIYEEPDNLTQIQDYSIFYDSDSNPYEKVLLTISGNTGLIKQLVRKQPFFNEVHKIISNLNLQFSTRGSLIQVTQTDSNSVTKQLYIFCSNDANYKLHMIYCYVLSEIGYQVCQITHKTSKDKIIQLLSLVFPMKQYQKRTQAFNSIQQDLVIQQEV